MIKTTLATKRAVSDIITAYRIILGDEKAPLSLRSFASSLSEVLQPLDGNISHQSIKNWEDQAFMPKSFFMKYLAQNAPKIGEEISLWIF